MIVLRSGRSSMARPALKTWLEAFLEGPLEGSHLPVAGFDNTFERSLRQRAALLLTVLEYNIIIDIFPCTLDVCSGTMMPGDNKEVRYEAFPY